MHKGDDDDDDDNNNNNNNNNNNTHFTHEYNCASCSACGMKQGHIFQGNNKNQKSVKGITKMFRAKKYKVIEDVMISA